MKVEARSQIQNNERYASLEKRPDAKKENPTLMQFPKESLKDRQPKSQGSNDRYSICLSRCGNMARHLSVTLQYRASQTIVSKSLCSSILPVVGSRTMSSFSGGHIRRMHCRYRDMEWRASVFWLRHRWLRSMGQGIKSRQTGCSSVFWMCVGFIMSGTSAYHWGFGWARHCEWSVNVTGRFVKGHIAWAYS